MQFQELAIKEQIVKKVVKSGNGGAVWVPRGWLGQEVVVILPEKPRMELREKIIHLLEPYLKDIISVFLYGSYARHEETKESDVDVVVLTKDKPIKIDAKEPNLEIISFQLEKFKAAIEKYPVMYYQIVQEAEPLINGCVLEDLRKINIKKEALKKYLTETKEHIKSNLEFIELDKLDGDYLKSYSVLYSLVLRLKGIFIMRCILDKLKFSNKLFRKWLLKNGFKNQEFEQSYGVYRAVRDNKSINKLKIQLTIAEKLLDILKKEIALLEGKLNDK